MNREQRRRMMHIVGADGKTTRRATFDDLAAELEQAQEIIVRQRRIIEALKLELGAIAKDLEDEVHPLTRRDFS
jgi:hypothetical protein